MEAIMELTTELRFLLYSAFLFFIFILIHAVVGISRAGLATAAGNRDDMDDLGVFWNRAKRLVDNMQENLVIFAILVIAGTVTGVSTTGTQMGAALFFYARLAHGIIYLVGIPWIRTVAWAVGVVGMVLMFIDILSA